jgi:Mg-chelatase subunit ChlD
MGEVRHLANKWTSATMAMRNARRLFCWCDQLPKIWRALAAAHDGGVTIIFTLALIPVVGFMGAAIDYSRANSARTAMQAALDSTALALSKSAATISAAELQQKAVDTFNALYNHTEVRNVTITARLDRSSGTSLTLTGGGRLDSEFMRIVGIPQIPIGAKSTATWGTTKLQVALVLDVTGSMARSGKMTALKQASHDLLDILQNASTNPNDVRVAIIPFNKDVNVDRLRYNATWLDWTDWDLDNGSYQGGGCRGRGYGRGGCNGRGNAGTWVPDEHNTWNGCVTDRDQNYDVQNTTPGGSSSTKFPTEEYDSCPTAILPLSNDWAALNRKIDQLQPAGNTNVTIGFAWGWQALTQGSPLNPPAPDPDTQRVIILLTDGQNTENRWTSSSPQIDARTQAVCGNIKAAGVTIYTVRVMEGNATLLRNCATQSDMYYDLNSSNEIVTAFKQIGTNLAKLRIAK